jgi:hypothetical protein
MPLTLTRLVHASYTPLTRLLHASYTPLTRLLHASYTPRTRLLHACYTPLTRLLLLQQQDTLSRQKGETGGRGLDYSDAGNRGGQHTSADAGVHGGRMWAKSECDRFVRMLAYAGVCWRMLAYAGVC